MMTSLSPRGPMLVEKYYMFIKDITPLQLLVDILTCFIEFIQLERQKDAQACLDSIGCKERLC